MEFKNKGLKKIKLDAEKQPSESPSRKTPSFLKPDGRPLPKEVSTKNSADPSVSRPRTEPSGDFIPPDEISRRKKERKRKQQKKKLGCFGLSFLFVLSLVMVILSYTVLFKIEKITVTDLSKYSEKQIVDTSGIVLDKNLLALNKKKVAGKLFDNLAYIESVKIKKKLPGEVILTPIYAKPAFAFEQKGGEGVPTTAVLLSSNGRVLETNVESYDRSALLFVRGTNLSDVKPCQDIKDTKNTEYAIIDSILKATTAANLKNISYINIQNRLDIILVYDGRIKVKLGPNVSMEKKLKFVEKIVNDDANAGKTGEIFTAVEGKAFFREMPAEELALELE